MTYDRPLLSRIITWLIAGLIVVLLLKLTLFLLGKVLGVGLFLALTIVPIIIVGWIAMKLWDAMSRPD